MGQWHSADEYDGQVREITFRSICNSPMCPPDTAMTEWQHAVLSADKKTLVQTWTSKMIKQLYIVFLPGGIKIFLYFVFRCLRLYNRHMMFHLGHTLRYVLSIAGFAFLERRKKRQPCFESLAFTYAIVWLQDHNLMK